MDEELGGLNEDDFILPPVKYEYLDHTADVQLHAWGDTLKEAFEQCGMAMFGYMTDLAYVQIKEIHTIEANADDLMGLLYHFLDELLFLFSVEPFLICKKLVITEFNTQEFRIVCKCYGEEFEIGKHPQGSEVKAITYSAMQIIDEPKDNKYTKFHKNPFNILDNITWNTKSFFLTIDNCKKYTDVLSYHELNWNVSVPGRNTARLLYGSKFENEFRFEEREHQHQRKLIDTTAV